MPEAQSPDRSAFATAQVRDQVAASLPESPAAPELIADGDPAGLLSRYPAGGRE